MLVWIATCSTRNHTADQLCSNRSLAMVTSLFSWFRSASKSCFIEGTSGESQNIPEVPITTPEFVCLPAFTHEETERPSGCCHSNFHSIMDVTGPCWASCGNVCSATCCLPKPGRFCVNLCVMFSPRAEEYPFQTCSLCIFLKCITTLVSFYLLFPLLHHSFSTSSSLFFVEGKPFLHSGYSADSVRFYSGTTEVRELRGRGKSNRHGKNTNTSYSCFSTRENMSSCESYI